MAGPCETIAAQRFQSGPRDNRRAWKWRRAKAGRRRNQASDWEYPIRDERPAPGVERTEGPRRCLLANRSWVKRVAPPSTHAKQQVTLQKRGQQWYGRPAAFISGGKPCSFNAIGAVTGTQRTFEPRTMEQGLAQELAQPNDGASGLGEPLGTERTEKAHFAREWGSARMRSSALRHSSRKPKPK